MITNSVCHITSGHERYDTRILKKECISLVKNGHDVYLIVNDKLRNEVYEGVNIISSGISKRNRLMRLFSTYRIYKIAMKLNAECYHLHEPNLLLLGKKLKKRKKKIIFDSHEDFPKHVSQSLQIPIFLRKFIEVLYSRIEKNILRKFDAVFAVSPQIVDRLKKVNVNTHLLTNYPFKYSGEIKKNVNTRKLVFVGGISSQWNHLRILDAIQQLEDVKYILAGYGPLDYLNKLKKHPAWEKVDYRGKVSFEQVKSIYEEANLALVLNISNQIKNIGTLGNTKMFECMNYGLPILCSDYVLWSNMVDKYDNGFTCDPFNVQDIKDSILSALGDSEILLQKSFNAKSSVDKEFNWSTQENVLINVYKEI